MKIVDAIATILKHEGVKFLSCFPTTPIIQACAAAGIRPQVFPFFSSARTYASVTRAVETLNLADEVSEVMRRAFNLLKNDRPGPVMVEVPADVALEEVSEAALQYTAVKSTRPAGNPREI